MQLLGGATLIYLGKKKKVLVCGKSSNRVQFSFNFLDVTGLLRLIVGEGLFRNKIWLFPTSVIQRLIALTCLMFLRLHIAFFSKYVSAHLWHLRLS